MWTELDLQGTKSQHPLQVQEEPQLRTEEPQEQQKVKEVVDRAFTKHKLILLAHLQKPESSDQRVHQVALKVEKTFYLWCFQPHQLTQAQPRTQQPGTGLNNFKNVPSL